MHIANSDIERLLIGIPKGHRHLRAVIELKGGQNLIFNEATLANLARAFTTVKTHPLIPALEMRSMEVSSAGDFARFQLIEVADQEPGDCQEELAHLLFGSQHDS